MIFYFILFCVYDLPMNNMLNSAFLFCRASDSTTDTESGSESESSSDSDGIDVPGKDQKQNDRTQKTGNALCHCVFIFSKICILPDLFN